MCAGHLHYLGQTFPSKEFIKQEILILKQEHAAKIQSLQNAKEANEVLDSVPGMSDLKTDDATTKQADIYTTSETNPFMANPNEAGDNISDDDEISDYESDVNDDDDDDDPSYEETHGVEAKTYKVSELYKESTTAKDAAKARTPTSSPSIRKVIYLFVHRFIVFV